MARGKKSEAIGILALILLSLLGLAVRYWFIAIPTIGLFILHSISARRDARNKAIATAHRVNVIKLGDALKRDLELALDGKSLKTRVSNCEDALNVLTKIEILDSQTNIISNKSELRRKLECLKRVLPIVPLVERQRKHAFMDEPRKELKVIKEILYNVNEQGVTDTDLQAAGLYQESGEPITIAFLQMRSNDLTVSEKGGHLS